MTIQLPEDLVRDMECVATTQRKSVEQVALEGLRSLFDQPSSPEVLLRTVRALYHPSLEAAVAAARLPVRDQGPFDK